MCREGEEIPSIHRRPRQPNVREGHAFRGHVWGTKAKPLASREAAALAYILPKARSPLPAVDSIPARLAAI